MFNEVRAVVLVAWLHYTKRSEVGAKAMIKEVIRNNTHPKCYSDAIASINSKFIEFANHCDEAPDNIGLFITPQQRRRELFFYEIYKLILDKPGSIAQFGVRWGRELAFFESLRTVFEPFNHSRRIVGFDTFAGYSGLSEKDGATSQMSSGNLSVSENHKTFLEELLRDRELLSPVQQYQKFTLVEGDVRETLEPYLEENPHEIFSLVHLDLNLYEPTKKVIQLIKPRLFSGSIIIVDEVNLKSIPGETVAIMEEFELTNLRLRRLPQISPTWPCYFEVS